MTKKVLILTSSGGGGHLSASDAVAYYLRNDYAVETLLLFKDLLAPLDIFKTFTAHKYSGEEVYNYFISKKYYKTLKMFYLFGSWYIQYSAKNIDQALRNYLHRNKPDLIISVIPLVNNIILSAAQDLNIPFLLIPTDLDVRMYIRNIINPTYKKFTICLPFDEQHILAPLIQAQIPDNSIFITGAPLKPSFFTEKDIISLKTEFGIPANKIVVMILMGAQGCKIIEKYIKHLITIDFPLHFIVCNGKNEETKNQIQLLHPPKHISMTIMSFTEKISDLLAVSDIFISKSGTLSVCEALYMNIPILLDATSSVLPWEQFNHTFITQHRYGNIITSYENCKLLIAELLHNQNKLLLYKKNIQSLQKKNAQREIVNIVKKMIN